MISYIKGGMQAKSNILRWAGHVARMEAGVLSKF